MLRASEGLTWAHRYEAASRTLEEALAIARAHGAPAMEAMALCGEAFQGVVTTGDFPRFGPILEAAIHAATDSGSAEALAHARLYLGETLEWRGQYADAFAVLKDVAATGRRLGLPQVVIWGDWFQAKAACCLGDYATGLALLRESRELCERIGDRAWRTRMLNTTGWALAEIAAEGRSREHNVDAERLSLEVGDPEIIANSRINLALNHLAAGELDDAEGHVRALQAQLAGSTDPWMRWRWSLHVENAAGRLALARHDPAFALAAGDRELAGAERVAARKIAFRADLLRASALQTLERLEDAEHAAARALATATAIAYPIGRWRALRVLAEVARRRGRREAEAAARADLERVTQALAGALPDDELRRALYAVATLGHDAAP